MDVDDDTVEVLSPVNFGRRTGGTMDMPFRHDFSDRAVVVVPAGLPVAAVLLAK